MGPFTHIGLTSSLLLVSHTLGFEVNKEIIIASILGGVLMDGDKVFEMVDNKRRAKRGEKPDITARWRLLHSIFWFPFALALSVFTSSFIPFFTVVFHLAVDTLILGLVKDGKHYPSHSPRKWIACPFLESWRRVRIGWPVTYPPKLNWWYKRGVPIIVGMILFYSILLFAIKY